MNRAVTAAALRQMLDEIGVLDDAGLQQSIEDVGLPRTSGTPLELLHFALRRYALRVVRDATAARDLARTLGAPVDASGVREGRGVYDLVASWVARTGDPRVPYHIVGVGTVLATPAQRARAIELGLPVRAASPRGSAHLADEVSAAYQRLAELGFDLPPPPASSWELLAAAPAGMFAVALDAADIGISLAITDGSMRPPQGRLQPDTLRALCFALGRVLPIDDVRVKARTYSWSCGSDKRQLDLDDSVTSLGALIDAIDADLARTSDLSILAIAFPSVTVAGDARYRVLVLPPGHAHALVAAGVPIVGGRRTPAPAVGRIAPLRFAALRPDDICARIVRIRTPIDILDEDFSEDDALDRVLALAGARIDDPSKRPRLLDEEGFADVDRYVRALNRALAGSEKFIAVKDSSDARVVTIAFGPPAIAKRLRDAGF